MTELHRSLTFLIAAALLPAGQSPPETGARQLYAVSGFPSNGGALAPILVYRVGGGLPGITPLRVASGEGITIPFMPHSHILRKIVFAPHSRSPPASIEVINMDRPWAALPPIPLKLPDMTSVCRSFLNEPDWSARFIVGLSDLKSFQELAVSLEDGSVATPPVEILGRELNEGRPFVDSPSVGFLDNVQTFDDGRLMLYWRKRFHPTEWRLPAEAPRGAAGQVQVNTPAFLVLEFLQDKIRRKGGIGETAVWILDKRRDKWQRMRVEGDYTRWIAFGDWIAAYVDTEMDRRINPGIADRARERRTGVPFDTWVGGYSTGRLMLYHVPTGRRHRIETRQGNSEVLLVDGRDVYYRSAQRLVKTTMGDKEELGAGRLLAEAPEVEDVHWLFWAPPPPADYKPSGLPPR